MVNIKKKRDSNILKINGIRNQNNVAGPNEITAKCITGTIFTIHRDIARKYQITTETPVNPDVASNAVMDDLEYQRKLNKIRNK